MTPPRSTERLPKRIKCILGLALESESSYFHISEDKGSFCSTVSTKHHSLLFKAKLSLTQASFCAAAESVSANRKHVVVLISLLLNTQIFINLDPQRS